MKLKLLAALCAVPCLAACQSDAVLGDPAPVESLPEEELIPAALGQTANVHAFGDIYLAAQPSPTDFEAARLAGIRTVVDLRKPSERPGFDEGTLVESLGMVYAPLPWNGPTELTDSVLDRGRELFETAERPLLVHCGSANRVGALWMAWRALDGGLTLDAAAAEAREVGLRTEAYEAAARQYVQARR